MSDLQVRFGEPGDAAQIASLFAGSFSPEVSQLLIYGCSGAAEYIRMQLACGVRTTESAYFVAQSAGEIVGATELRRQSNRLFLNYIGVRSGHRGKRVGANLLLEAVRMSGVSSGQIGLDVFQDNVQALHWYRGLGFEIRQSSEFLEIVPPGSTEEQPVYISGLPQADLCQERFGFSKFKLITNEGTFAVGRIANTWFRLTDLAAVCNASVFSALSALDSGRRIFAVLPAPSLPLAQGARLLGKTHRMEVEIRRLITLLGNDY